MDPLHPLYGEPGAIYGAVYYSAGPANPQPNPPIKMAQIKQTLSRYNPTQMVDLAAKQATLMAPAAPATPPIPNMAAAITDLKTAHDAAKTANDAYEMAKSALASLKTARDDKADALRTKLTLVQNKAQAESGGEASMLQAAGYEIASATTTPPSTVPQPQNLTVTAGDMDGSVDVSCDPPSGAKTYEWQVSTADPVNGPYTTAKQTTTSTATLSGLTSGQRIWVRVRAIGSKGEGPWSDPATKIVP